MRRLFATSLALVGFLLPVVPSTGQTARGQTTLAVPEDAKFVVQLDIDTFRETQLGEKLLKLTQQMAQEEIGGESGDVMAQVEEALGFNPLEEIHQLTLIGANYESPEDSLRAILQLGKTTGNLEGLMLALPGYESHEHGDMTIHSVKDNDMEAYAAIHTLGDGRKRIVAATSEDAVNEMLTEGQGKRRQISWTVPKGTFVQVQLLEFPDEVFENEQSSNIAKLLQDVSATIGEKDDNYEVNLTLTTVDEKRAEQIQQLLQGAKALVGLLENEIGDDEDAKMAISLLKQVTVEKDGHAVTVHGAIPEDLIINFLREEADLPL